MFFTTDSVMANDNPPRRDCEKPFNQLALSGPRGGCYPSRHVIDEAIQALEP